MSRQGRMIKTTIIYFIGNFASKLLSFFLLPLYTAYLTVEDFGQADLFMSTLPLIAPIFTMQVTESVFRFLCTNKEEEERKKTITNSLIIFLTGTLIFAILYVPFAMKFKLEYALLFFLYFLITYIGIFFQQVLRGLQRNLEYAINGIIITVVQATLNIVLITRFGMGGESLLIAATTASLIIAIIVALRIKIWTLISFKMISKEEIRKQLVYGLPLIPNQICWWVIGLLGKYILLYYSGSGDNGILAVASKFPALLTTINSIFFLAWTENIIKEFDAEDRDEYFSKSFVNFFIFSISAAACLLPVIRVYNAMTISGEFIEAWRYVPILYLGAVFNGFSSFLGTAYTASMQTKAAFTTTIVSAISNLIISLILIPFFSIWGVVFANMISFMVLFGVRIKSIRKIVGIKFNILKLLPSTILIFTAIFIYYTGNLFGQIIFLITSAIISLWLNKDVLVGILAIKKNKDVKRTVEN